MLEVAVEDVVGDFVDADAHEAEAGGEEEVEGFDDLYFLKVDAEENETYPVNHSGGKMLSDAVVLGNFEGEGC